MPTTSRAPKVSIKSFKRTKIIATIGPSTDSYEKIYGLIAAGANCLRLNFSHGTFEERDRQIPWIRQASAELNKPVAIIQDLQGPKIRLGDFEGEITVKAGENLSFEYLSKPESGHVPIQYALSKKVKAGERLFLCDGRIKTEITDVRDGVVYATAQNAGVLLKRKGMNLPDTDFGGDVLTEKDIKDIHYGAKQDFDYIATSFVQSAQDIRNLRKILQDVKHPAVNHIIAKVETKAAVDSIEEIVKAADAIMVARGDLAVETPAETVPITQRLIVSYGQQYGKPTIVATQMLLSMMEMLEPTRAEASDVATAVFIGADCVMLSDETAMGKHPLNVVRTMKRILMQAEKYPQFKSVYQIKHESNIANAIASSILTMAEDIKASAIVAETKSGAAALRIAARRPAAALLAVTSEARTAQQLALVYGVQSFVRPDDAQAALKLTDSLQEDGQLKAGDAVVTVSGSQPGVSGTTDTIRIRIL
ncbi:MAG TPA: pyruvate kinase [Patescibacteria group bacterium]|nr:pyruvate kinase [Patescibacteria group bacterium]